ncbi:3-hydroxyacyl-CoA dehydrogenase NAD-binding domain-containing protein [Candidatus Berkiella cookevillensis]|nr:3-hydroxyacyl-CoA dehydrogenase/enoyl-CoA hydratase family protein [Candidatus Berkiella cookevillensis]
MKSLLVRKAAVLGAGVMGAQIAAHLANQGIQTILFDLAGDTNQPNAISENAIKSLEKLKPPPLGAATVIQRIIPANYDHHLELLKQCDLVIEAISERMDWKKNLYKKISPYLNDKVVLASNTSGLSIEQLKDGLPKVLQNQFCGIHFFNPPRYMKLVEIIPHSSTSQDIISQLESFLVSRLGKGVIIAKDTPNFIGNRVGVFSLLSVLYHAESLNISPDLVDALTGPLIGRPKSATFRTMDVVGLDTLAHVVTTMSTQLEADPWSNRFKLPNWVQSLIEKGALGQKAKAGIYKKEKDEIRVFDAHDKQYRKIHAELSQAVKDCFKEKSWETRFSMMSTSNDKQLQFLWRTFRDLFHYCAYHLKEIANTARDVDLAMRWGYGWEQGPFEIWQSANWHKIANQISAEKQDKEAIEAILPAWATKATFTGAYHQGQSYDPHSDQYEPRSDNPVYQRQIFPDRVLTEKHMDGDTLYENEGVRLWTRDKEIGILSFKSKKNCIGDEVLIGTQEAILRAEKDLKGLVIWQNKEADFSVGANLVQVKEALEVGRYDKLEHAVTEFQKTAMMLRYASIPTVCALKGLVLGGGCEIAMHATRRVAAFESYVGLVEVSVGLLPAGGGTKELARKAYQISRYCRLDQPVGKFFEQIVKAQVSASANEAKQLCYLEESDFICANENELLFVALEVAKNLASIGYAPPVSEPFAVLGKAGIANMQTMLVNLREGEFITDYEYLIGQQIAKVLCGSTVESGSIVNEDWMLKLERDALLELLHHDETQERIKHMLKTGKPLRN